MATNDGDVTKHVSVVIGSGSVKCAAAIGLENVLRREGIAIDSVVGCSGGSLYAALIAMGVDAQNEREMTQRLWTHDITSRHRLRSVLHMALPRLFGFDEQFGVIDDSLVMQRLRGAFGGRTFEQMQIPLYLVATDFHTGEQVTLSQGDLLGAIRASISIPFIFRPWKVEGRLLTDGFLSDPMPVDVAVKAGAHIVLAMGFESPYQEHINSAMRFAFQISSIMTNNLFKSNLTLHTMNRAVAVIPVIPHFKKHIHLFETEEIPCIIEEGERATEAQLPELRRALA